MPTIIDGEKCVWCVAQACAQVCAMDALYTDGIRTYINPFECTTDHACIPECPVEAIWDVDSDDNPEVVRNTELFRTRPEHFQSLAATTRRTPLTPQDHELFRAGLLAELARAAALFGDTSLMPEIERFLPVHAGDPPADPSRAFSSKLRELIETCFPGRVLDMTERIRALRTGPV